jgi:hypothetical protein
MSFSGGHSTRSVERLLLADALYAAAPFFNFLLTHRKHALVVLKQERRDLYVDAKAMFAQQAPKLGLYRGRRCEWWDSSALCSWPQVQTPVRVIRSPGNRAAKARRGTQVGS